MLGWPCRWREKSQAPQVLPGIACPCLAITAREAGGAKEVQGARAQWARVKAKGSGAEPIRRPTSGQHDIHGVEGSTCAWRQELT